MLLMETFLSECVV